MPGTSPTYWMTQMAEDPQLIDTALDLLLESEDT